MATLADYFTRDSRTFTVHREVEVPDPDDATATVAVTARLHYDVVSSVKYLSFFFPTAAANSDDLILAVFRQLAEIVEHLQDGTRITMGSTPGGGIYSNEQPLDPTTLPFSSKVFIYADAVMVPGRADALLEYLKPMGLRIEFRDAEHAKRQAAAEQPLAFISHDSRDKDDLVRELVMELGTLICPVWYDEYSMKLGDSLRASIDQGLRDCPKCIVILSPNFCDGTGWTGMEFNGAFGRHVEMGGNVIIPVWHEMTKADVTAFSPMIADLVALNTSVGIPDLARRLYIALTT